MEDQSRKDNILYISCGKTEFGFPLDGKEDAWYSLDHRISRNGNETLELNADRDVYAVYTDGNGTKHYGTVGDAENRVLADNESCTAGERYIFYENPKTEKCYV